MRATVAKNPGLEWVQRIAVQIARHDESLHQGTADSKAIRVILACQAILYQEELLLKASLGDIED